MLSCYFETQDFFCWCHEMARLAFFLSLSKDPQYIYHNSKFLGYIYGRKIYFSSSTVFNFVCFVQLSHNIRETNFNKIKYSGLRKKIPSVKIDSGIFDSFLVGLGID